MPTGYTAALEEGGYNVKKWLKENAVRAMGICYGLRDHGHLSQDGIVKFLKNLVQEESYHVKRLREAQEELQFLTTRNEAELKRQYVVKLAAATSSYTARIEDHNRKKMNHMNALADATLMYNEAVKTEQSELTVNTLKFAVSQLTESYQFDYGHPPYKDSIVDQTFEQWKESSLKEAHRNVEYHTRHLKEETEKASGEQSAKMYEEFVEFIDSFK